MMDEKEVPTAPSMRETLEDAYEDAESKAPMPPRDFAAAMVEHAGESIRMAKAYLAGKQQDATLTALAQDVITRQQAEIDTLQEWLAGTPRSTQE